MELLLSLAVGIGLSAACGFRVFVPLLIMNLAAINGLMQLSPGFAWIGTHYATVAFATATIIEIFGYYIPVLDHLLDLLATPAAVVAGTVVTASAITDLSPFLKWTLSLIAGGGIAGLVQGGTAALRAGSLLTTAGLGNPVVATLELVAAIGMALLAIIVPIACLSLLVIGCVALIGRLGRSVLARSKPT